MRGNGTITLTEESDALRHIFSRDHGRFLNHVAVKLLNYV